MKDTSRFLRRALLATTIAASAMLSASAPSLAQREVSTPGPPAPPQPSAPSGPRAVAPAPAPAPSPPPSAAASGPSDQRSGRSRSDRSDRNRSNHDQHYNWSERGQHYGAHDDWRRPDWRYSDTRRYYDRDRWRGGRWYHGPHDGRLAWWWILGNDWFAYDQPVYPYPDPDYAPPPTYYDPSAVPPPAYAQPAPPPAPPGLVYDPYTGQYRPQDGGTTSYFYCYNPPGYYPQVLDCPSGWVAVPPG